MALLLDALTPTLAFSTRRVLTAYAGNCLRIRATGDNVEADFGFVSDIVDKAGIAAHIATHGGTAQIVTWYDQSGNARNLSQATAGSQPTFVAASALHGNATASFDGGDSLTATVNLQTVFGSNNGTFLVGQVQNGTQGTNTTIFGENTDRFNLHATYSNTLIFDYGTEGATGRISAAQPAGWDDIWHVTECFRQTDNTQAIYVDGALVVQGSCSKTIGSFSTTLYLGTDNATEILKGEITELFAFATDIGSTDRTTVRLSMMGYIGAATVGTEASTLTALTAALVGGSGQALFADGDVSAGSWTTETGATTGLYASIGESAVDDTTYIRSVEHPSADIVTLTMGDPIQPLGSGAAGVVLRYYKEGSETINLIVRLMEGASVIKTWTYTDISSTLTQANETLSAAEVATIVDPANLRWQYEASSV